MTIVLDTTLQLVEFTVKEVYIINLCLNRVLLFFMERIFLTDDKLYKDCTDN